MLPVIRLGSMTNLVLTSIATMFFTLCAGTGATLTVVWVPIKENTDADDISKLEDKDDWQLVPSVFNMLSLRWDLQSCDRLASDLKHQIPRLYSLRWCQGTARTDEFDHSRGNPLENNWGTHPSPSWI
jgi:hypothetical protein